MKENLWQIVAEKIWDMQTDIKKLTQPTSAAARTAFCDYDTIPARADRYQQLENENNAKLMAHNAMIELSNDLGQLEHHIHEEDYRSASLLVEKIVASLEINNVGGEFYELLKKLRDSLTPSAECYRA